MNALLLTTAAAGLALMGLVRAARTALITADAGRIRERAEKGELAALRTAHLLESPTSAITALSALANLLLVVAAAAGLGLVLAWETTPSRPMAALITLAALVPTALVIGVAIPATLARPQADRILVPLTRPLGWLRAAWRPFESLGGALIRAGARVAGPSRWAETQPVSKEHVLEFVERGEAEGEIESSERQMIHRIFGLHETRVSEIMRPLIHVAALNETELSVGRLAALARSTGHSRIPVFRTYILNLIGHVDIYEVLRADLGDPDAIREFIHPPRYVPETKRVDDLLQEFLSEGRRVAIVIDEHGACSGWVTREDILEEIFGEITDEFDRERPRWQAEPGGSVLFEAGVDIDDVNAHFGLAIPTEHCDTLGGFLYERLGRVPRLGEAIRHGGRRLRVVEMREQQIVSIRLEPAPTDAQ